MRRSSAVQGEREKSTSGKFARRRRLTLIAEWTCGVEIEHENDSSVAFPGPRLVDQTPALALWGYHENDKQGTSFFTASTEDACMGNGAACVAVRTGAFGHWLARICWLLLVLEECRPFFHEVLWLLLAPPPKSNGEPPRERTLQGSVAVTRDCNCCAAVVAASSPNVVPVAFEVRDSPKCIYIPDGHNQTNSSSVLSI